jgi:hypothetical protein
MLFKNLIKSSENNDLLGTEDAGIDTELYNCN